MKSVHAWIAGLLSALTHACAFGLVAFLSASTSYTPPTLIDVYGDSDREGFPVNAVSLDPGTYRQGSDHTPGGENGERPAPVDVNPEPAETSPPTVPEPPALAEVPALIAPDDPLPEPPAPAPPAVLLSKPEPRLAPTDKVASRSGEVKRPGAPGGANMRLGTPSAGGTAGKANGVRMIDPESRPTYPEAARLAGVEGAPVIRMRISTDGRVLVASIQRSCGHRILDEAALRWARTRRFVPARQDGTPVEADVTKEIRFTLY